MTIPERQEFIDALTRKYLTPPEPKTAISNGAGSPKRNGASPPLSDEEVIALCRKAENAAKFSDLFGAGDTSPYDGDASRADLALVAIMAFYTQDPEQLDRLFRCSALVRPKWERRPDYRRRTIERALGNLRETYTAPREQGVPVPVPLNRNGYRYTSENGAPRRVQETTQKRTRLRAVRFSEMGNPEPPRYLLEGLLPEGYPTLLYGDGGVAKSLIALSIALAVARGVGSWLGHAVKGGPVLYLDFELDEAEQNRRIRRLAAAEGLSKPPDALFYMSALGYKPKHAFEDALSECTEHGGKLIIVDSLGPAMEGDMEAARDVIGFFQQALEPFRAAGVTVLAVDHQSKLQAGERYQGKRAFGSVFKGNLARSVVQVEAGERSEGTLSVRLRQNKHNFGTLAEPFGIRLTFTEEKITLDQEDIDPAERATEGTLNAKERVLLSLVDGPAYPDEIADTTYLARQTVKNTLSKLRKESFVEKTGECDHHNAEQVQLTEEGKRYTRTSIYKEVRVRVHRVEPDPDEEPEHSLSCKCVECAAPAARYATPSDGEVRS